VLVGGLGCWLEGWGGGGGRGAGWRGGGGIRGLEGTEEAEREQDCTGNIVCKHNGDKIIESLAKRNTVQMCVSEVRKGEGKGR
jgi:hypothetical protein